MKLFDFGIDPKPAKTMMFFSTPRLEEVSYGDWIRNENDTEKSEWDNEKERIILLLQYVLKYGKNTNAVTNK